MYNTHSLWQK